MHIEEELYQKIKKTIPIVGVDVVVFNCGYVLLLKRRTEPLKDKWWFPGGGIDFKEHPRDAAARELREETGISSVFDTYVTILNLVYPKEHSISIVYSAVVDTWDVKINEEEHSEFKWFRLFRVHEVLSLQGLEAILSANYQGGSI